MLRSNIAVDPSGAHVVADSHRQGARGSYQARDLSSTRAASTDAGADGQPSPRSLSPSPFQPTHLPPVQEYHNAFVDVSLRPTHRRQQSFPNLLPIALRNRANSPEGRVRPPRPISVEMPFTGDARRSGKNNDVSRGGGFASWLSGNSPISMAQYRSDDGTPPASRGASPNTTPTRPRGDATSPSGDPSKQTPSRFATFASSMTATLSRLTQAPVSPTTEDELLSMDVEAALFPSGSPGDRDPFSPAAFKNLQATATGLLLRMQSAYRQRARALSDLAAEKGAQKDELEEAETRAQNFKMQLEGMARKAAQQEADMKALMDDLIAEKKARAHERLMRERGLAAITVTQPLLSEGSTISEDLGVDDDHRRRPRGWRKSDGSTGGGGGGGGYDTDDESVEDESVFSRSRSPTIAPSAYEGSVVDGPIASHPRVAALGQQGGPAQAPGRPRPAAQPQPPMTTFQKIVKNVASALKEDDDELGGAGPGSGCRNCRGQDASFAWNTVSLLRDENKQLKQRVGQLETAVEGALDLANGIGLDLK